MKHPIQPLSPDENGAAAEGKDELSLARQEPAAWTERELTLIDEMIDVHLYHAKRCDSIANRTMAEKQKAWDLERVALLQKIKATPPAAPAQEAVGEAEPFDGVSTDHTQCIFHKDKVPVGSKLYTCPQPAPVQEPDEGYPSNWAKVVMMVSPKGEMHAIGGDREPGHGDMPYVGFELIKSFKSKVHCSWELQDGVMIVRVKNGRIVEAAEQPAAQPAPDCGEAGHAEQACGNASCWPSLVATSTKPAPLQEPEKHIGMYEHRCPQVTGHRGPSFVCQKAGLGVSQDSYCEKCTCPEALKNLKKQQEPVQEPVAVVAETHLSRYTIEWKDRPLPEGTELYASPQPEAKQEPLTDEQIHEAVEFWHKTVFTEQEDEPSVIEIARAIEAAHNIGAKE